MPTCVPEWSLFLLDHPFPSQLATSQWQSDASSPSAGYLAYRAVLCVLGVAGMAAYIATLTYDKYLFPIFLTHWGFSLLVAFEAVDLALLCVESCRRRRGRRREVSSSAGGQDHLGPLHRSSWVLSNVACAGAPFISAFYWIVLYDPATEGAPTFWNVMVHGLNSAAVLVEVLVTARPWRWHHFYQPAIAGLLYVLFSLIYHVSGGKGKDGESYIYKILDWNNSGKATLVSAGAVGAVVLTHLANCGLCRLRRRLRRLLDRRKGKKVTPTVNVIGPDSRSGSGSGGPG